MQSLPPSQYLFHHPDESDYTGEGCVGIGADLAPETILAAYQAGIFPWFAQDDPICWWSPDPRCIIYPAQFKPSQSLVRQIKKNQYTITLSHCFKAVITACSKPRAYAQDTWICPEIIEGYTGLHQAGLAHSVEVWAQDMNSQTPQLVGGLYGVQLGSAFFGESMFSLRTDVSKMAFFFLMRLCAASGFNWVDCQFENAHLMRLGATTIPRAQFLKSLAIALQNPRPNWQKIQQTRFDCVQLLDNDLFDLA